MDARKLLKLFAPGGLSATEIYRYERKYVVSETAADAIRRFIAPHLTPDEHMSPDEPRGYQVFSLYIDTPLLSFYRQTVEGVRSRYKLRIRFYDAREEGLALFEIKTREADSIHKQRAAVPKSAVAKFLTCGYAPASDLMAPSEKSTRALAQFCERSDRLGCVPMAFVSYWREAYVSREPDDVRVTLDRHLAGRDGRFAQSLHLPESQSLAAPNKVVLELKNSGRAPNWMRDLVRTFKLERVSFPKYVYCVDALGLAAHTASSAYRSAEGASCPSSGSAMR
jgi:hypothetical protein